MKARSTAGDAMTVDVVTVSPACSITDAATLLARNRIGVLPVVDPAGRLLGVLSTSDIVWLRAHEVTRLESQAGDEPAGAPEPGADVPAEVASYWYHLGSADARRRWWDHDACGEECTVEAIYTPDPITVAPDEPLDRVSRLMRDHKIHHVIVVDRERRPVGVIGTLDVLALAA